MAKQLCSLSFVMVKARVLGSWHICVFTPVTYNVVDPIFSVVIHIFFGAFRLVAKHGQCSTLLVVQVVPVAAHR